MLRSVCFFILIFGGFQVLFSQTQRESFTPISQSDKNLIWYDDFANDDLCRWEVTDVATGEPSNWYIEQGYLIQNSNMGNSKKLLGTNILAGDCNWSNYFIKTKIITTDNDYVGVLFRYQDENNYYCFIHSSQRRKTFLAKRVSGVYTVLDDLKSDDAYLCLSLTFSALHDTLAVYLDDKLILSAIDNEFTHGKIGFLSCANTGIYVDYISVLENCDITPVTEDLIFDRFPYVQSVLGDSAKVLWGTNLPSSTIIEYGLSENIEFSNSKDGVFTNHEIELKGLKPATRYYYRVRSDDLESNWLSFKSAPDKETSFKFIAYGDTQLDFLRHADIVSQFKKNDFDLIIHAGDVVQHGPQKNWSQEFFNPLKDIISSKPIYVSIGNHQLDGKYFYDYFAFPNSEHENYYSFKYANAFFIFLDNRRAAYPDKEFYPEISKGSKQYNWLVNQLSSKEAQEAEWLFVVSHVPSYLINSQDFYPDCRDYLVPLFEKYDVDISFSGHVHGYDRGSVNDVHYVLTAGGGGQISKSASKKEKIKDCKHCRPEYNYCLISIEEGTLKFTAYNIVGNVIDEFEIKKK